MGSLVNDANFMADLKMSQAWWLYHEGKRVLVVQKNIDKPSASEALVRKAWRKLGATTWIALDSKKPENVKVLLTKCAWGANAAILVNSFLLSNHEKVYKTPKARMNDEVDPRTLKVSRIIGSVDFAYEIGFV